MASIKLPRMPIKPEAAVFGKGLDTQTPPLLAKAGVLRAARNVEPAVEGGVERFAGFERYDGRPEPWRAQFVVLDCEAAVGALAVPGATVTCSPSGASGVVIASSGARVALTKVIGTPAEGDVLTVGVTVVGTVADADGPTTGAEDNDLQAAASSAYRADIGEVPGAGPVRGLAMLGARLYAWRNTEDSTELALWRASTTGWQRVAMLWEAPFSTGSAEWAEGAAITQGGVSAAVARVVLESGDWATGSAAGRLIVTEPAGGAFAAGAAGGGGAATLTGPSARITLAPGGTVRCVRANFFATADSAALYGCDGVNREFELRDDVLAPLEINAPDGKRAKVLHAHKSHLFAGGDGWLQHSSTGWPAQWDAVTGAALIGTADTVADLVTVPGSETSAAMMVLCTQSLHVLYGSNSTDWVMVPLSTKAGCWPRTAAQAVGVLAVDTPGVVRVPSSDRYGNFAWDVVSTQIDQIAAGCTPACAVWLPRRQRYRVFLADGTVLSGLVLGERAVEWSLLDFGDRVVSCAVADELDGDERCFVGTQDGAVLELDVGRSLDGQPLPWMVRLAEMSGTSPLTVKQWRAAELVADTRSPTLIQVAAEFDDIDLAASDPTLAAVQTLGAPARWDITSFDASYWDAGDRQRQRINLEGQGTAVHVILSGESDREAPMRLQHVSLLYSPLRLVPM
ncbi:MAG: hypothetical protein RIQ53_2622 [Pseudomonadota bacterium]|jgi:hypothetical protein